MPIKHNTILHSWNATKKLPLGRWLFSFLLSRRIPYSGSIHAEIVSLSEGQCIIRMRDRKKVRNHLSSIHAIALLNLGELCGGLAMHTRLPGDCKAIITRLEADYLKKARGAVTAESHVSNTVFTDGQTLQLETTLFNENREQLATVTAHWKIRKDQAESK